MMTIATSAGMRVRDRGEMSLFWWAFALRGGGALVFAAVLWFGANLLGTLFLDPVLLVTMSLLLGFYVFSNGVLLGVGGVYAKRHELAHWQVLCAEAVFAVGLAAYIGFSLTMTSESLARLAALHCAGTGVFQCAAGWRVRGRRVMAGALGVAGVGLLVAAVVFLWARGAGVATVAEWLSGFELVFGGLMLAVAVRLHGVGGEAEESGRVATGHARPFTVRS